MLYHFVPITNPMGTLREHCGWSLRGSLNIIDFYSHSDRTLKTANWTNDGLTLAEVSRKLYSESVSAK
jgi:hypothetical protein